MTAGLNSFKSLNMKIAKIAAIVAVLAAMVGFVFLLLNLMIPAAICFGIWAVGLVILLVKIILI